MLGIDVDRLTKSELGPVWGPIWIDCPEFGPFPAEGWDDILIPILTAWIHALVSLVQENGRTATVHFMDGPFRVALKLEGPEVCVHLFRDTHEGAVLRVPTYIVRYPLEYGGWEKLRG